MNKFIGGFLTIFLSLSTIPFFQTLAGAEQDPKTLKFLEEINRHYYCLYREGLNDYKCQVKISLFDSAKNGYAKKFGSSDKRVKLLDRVRFYIEDSQHEPTKIYSSEYPLTGDEDFDSTARNDIDNIRKLVEDLMAPWAMFVEEPVFPERELTQYNFRVEKEKDGMEIFISFENGDEGHVHLDQLMKITSFTGDENAVRGCRPLFLDRTGGFLLKRWETLLPQTSKKQFGEITYRKVGKFLMPDKLTIHVKDKKVIGGSESVVSLIFIDYSINRKTRPAKEDRKSVV